MEIDPWGDLEDIQGFEPPIPELAPDDFEPVTMFPDHQMFSLNSGAVWQVSTNISFPITLWWGATSPAQTQTVPVVSSMNFLNTLEYQELYYYDFNNNSLEGISFGYRNNTGEEGFEITCVTAGDYFREEYVLNGTVHSAMRAKVSDDSGDAKFVEVYAEKVDILAGDFIIATVELDDTGSFMFDDFQVEIPSDVTTSGYKFYYPELVTGVSELSWGHDLISVGHVFQDGVTLDEYDPSLGLLGSIIEWLQSILDAIVSLPRNIANFILDGLQALFIPDQEELTGLMDKYDVLFEERLGFIYQMFSFVVDAFTTWVDTMKSGEDYSFVFPGISVPYNGETLEVLPETEVSLENAAMDVLRPVLGTVIGMVAVVAFGNTCFDLVVAFMSGQSYFQFISGKKEEDAA